MTRSVAAGSAAVLATLLAAGVVIGQSADDTSPSTFRLTSSGSQGDWAAPDGSSTLLKEGLLDAHGQDAGTAVWRCSSAEKVAWVCEAYLDLVATSDTAEGSIVAQGLFDGFNGESLAITGGTGAYRGVRGEATLSVEDDKFTWTLAVVR
jgi:hypothetical protein